MHHRQPAHWREQWQALTRVALPTGLLHVPAHPPPQPMSAAAMASPTQTSAAPVRLITRVHTPVCARACAVRAPLGAGVTGLDGLHDALIVGSTLSLYSNPALVTASLSRSSTHSLAVKGDTYVSSNPELAEFMSSGTPTTWFGGALHVEDNARLVKFGGPAQRTGFAAAASVRFRANPNLGAEEMCTVMRKCRSSRCTVEVSLDAEVACPVAEMCLASGEHSGAAVQDVDQCHPRHASECAVGGCSSMVQTLCPFMCGTCQKYECMGNQMYTNGHVASSRPCFCGAGCAQCELDLDAARAYMLATDTGAQEGAFGSAPSTSAAGKQGGPAEAMAGNRKGAGPVCVACATGRSLLDGQCISAADCILMGGTVQDRDVMMGGQATGTTHRVCERKAAGHTAAPTPTTAMQTRTATAAAPPSTTAVLATIPPPWWSVWSDWWVAIHNTPPVSAATSTRPTSTTSARTAMAAGPCSKFDGRLAGRRFVGPAIAPTLLRSASPDGTGWKWWECAAECAHHPGCSYWYVPTKSRTCVFKSRRTADLVATPSAATSGHGDRDSRCDYVDPEASCRSTLRGCESCPTLPKGGLFRGKLLRVIKKKDAPNGGRWAWYQCGARCAAEERCVYWHLHPKTRNCMLRSSKVGTVINVADGGEHGMRSAACTGYSQDNQPSLQPGGGVGCTRLPDAGGGFYGGKLLEVLPRRLSPSRRGWAWYECAGRCTAAAEGACSYWYVTTAKTCVLRAAKASSVVPNSRAIGHGLRSTCDGFCPSADCDV